MKRGQTEVSTLLLAFELIIVLLSIFYFYQVSHTISPASQPEIEKQLNDLALRTAVGVEQVHLVPSSTSLLQTQRDVS